MAKPLLAQEKYFNEERRKLLRRGVTAKTCDNGSWLQIPQEYIRPPSERLRLQDVTVRNDISLIDLTHLNGPNRQSLIRQIRSACQQDGFFQVINHGVAETVINGMLEVGTEYFTMPMEYREQFYSEDPCSAVRLSTSFNVQTEEVCNWRDYFRHHCDPLEKYVDAWPAKPAAYREVVGKYCTEVRELVLRLLAAISESLGLEQDFLDKSLGEHAQHMAINYYPRCPNPELKFGLPAHTDPNALTVLLQGHVSGLHVLKNGQWCVVEPIPNAFVINVGTTPDNLCTS